MGLNLQIIAELKNFITQAYNQRAKYCNRTEDFSRTRTLTFEHVIFFILNLSKKSLQVELQDLFPHLTSRVIAPTKGAFSKARYKLKALFFQDWNACLLQCYNQLYPKKTWKGFLIYGIDGSTLNLPNTAKIGKEFGYASNQSSSYPMARVVCSYDVLNGICQQNKIASIHEDELSMVTDFVDELPENSLSIYDRGFASFALVYLLQGKNYVMRCKISFNKTVKDFIESNEKTAIVTFKATPSAIKRLSNSSCTIDKNSTVTVRLVKVVLDNGETEVLITSLLDTKRYPNHIFKDLYFLRWGVEVFFDYFKNILQAELFSGHLPEAIYQEFYTMIFIANLHSLLLKDCEKQLQQDNKTRKYEHKINNNVSLGYLKNNIIKIFISQDPKAIIERLVKLSLRSTEAVRPNRKYERTKPKRSRGKYRTFTNYRRAV